MKKKPLNPIERAAFEAMNEWRKKHDMPMLPDPEEELEPTWDWPDDHKTDDPRRGQAKDINR